MTTSMLCPQSALQTVVLLTAAALYLTTVSSELSHFVGLLVGACVYMLLLLAQRPQRSMEQSSPPEECHVAECKLVETTAAEGSLPGKGKSNSKKKAKKTRRAVEDSTDDAAAAEEAPLNVEHPSEPLAAPFSANIDLQEDFERVVKASAKAVKRRVRIAVPEPEPEPAKPKSEKLQELLADPPMEPAPFPPMNDVQLVEESEVAAVEVLAVPEAASAPDAGFGKVTKRQVWLHEEFGEMGSMVVPVDESASPPLSPDHGPLDREIIKLENQAHEVGLLQKRVAAGEVLEEADQAKLLSFEAIELRLTELNVQRIVEQIGGADVVPPASPKHQKDANAFAAACAHLPFEAVKMLFGDAFQLEQGAFEVNPYCFEMQLPMEMTSWDCYPCGDMMMPMPFVPEPEVSLQLQEQNRLQGLAQERVQRERLQQDDMSCYSWVSTGRCRRGATCRWTHPPLQ